MPSENCESAIRINNRTSASETATAHRAGTSARQTPTKRGLRTVVVVSNDPSDCALGSLPNLPDYDVVFVESIGHAYSQIKRVVPTLVIVYLEMDDPAVFQVLSMLRLDDDTSHIPIETYTRVPVSWKESGLETARSPSNPELFA
jgi:hypothetical protein